MSKKAKGGDAAKSADAPAQEGKAKGKGKLLLMAVPVLLACIGAGLWFTGILPSLLGIGHAEAHAEAHGEGHGEAHGEAGHGKAGEKTEAAGPIFVELPDIVANLNAGPRKTTYVKLKVRLEMARPEDEAAAKAVMPRLLDLFQTYLRETRPEELRGSAGSYRLREELTGRANVAMAPARVQNVLFTEMLIQ